MEQEPGGAEGAPGAALQPCPTLPWVKPARNACVCQQSCPKCSLLQVTCAPTSIWLHTLKSWRKQSRHSQAQVQQRAKAPTREFRGGIYQATRSPVHINSLWKPGGLRISRADTWTCDTAELRTCYTTAPVSSAGPSLPCPAQLPHQLCLHGTGSQPGEQQAKQTPALAAPQETSQPSQIS